MKEFPVNLAGATKLTGSPAQACGAAPSPLGPSTPLDPGAPANPCGPCCPE